MAERDLIIAVQNSPRSLGWQRSGQPEYAKRLLTFLFAWYVLGPETSLCRKLDKHNPKLAQSTQPGWKRRWQGFNQTRQTLSKCQRSMRRNSVTPVKTLFHLLLSAAELTPFVANLRRVAFREVHDEIMSVRLSSRLISGKTTRNDHNLNKGQSTLPQNKTMVVVIRPGSINLAHASKAYPG